MWIRSPKFDAVWFLSGIPIGIALVLIGLCLPSFVQLCPVVPQSVMLHTPSHIQRCNPFSISNRLLSIYAVVLFDMGHSLSPIILAWTHSRFRRAMLRQPMKFIGLPYMLILGGTAAGVISSHFYPDWTPFVNSAMQAYEMWPIRLANPFWCLVVGYLIWNFYHFSKQNFGMMSLYRVRSGVVYPKNQRTVDLVFGFTIQAIVFTAVALALVQSALIIDVFRLGFFLGIACVIVMIVREAAITGRWWTPRMLFAISQTVPLMFPGLLTIASNGINHWLTAIGLAAHIDANNHKRSPLWFAMILIVGGIALGAGLFWTYTFAWPHVTITLVSKSVWGFPLKVPYPTGWPIFHAPKWSWNPRTMIVMLLPLAGFRLAVGGVHFLYDRWLYRLSSPMARSTIGPDLFDRPPVALVYAAE